MHNSVVAALGKSGRQISPASPNCNAIDSGGSARGVAADEGLKGRFRAEFAGATNLSRDPTGRLRLKPTENCECFSRLELGVGN